jgi:ribonuclease T2
MKAIRLGFLVALLSLFFSAGAAAQQRSGGQPGVFDYYQLNLSWSPEFCFSKPGNPECAGHFGFIVHGLWPQFNNGGWPEFCGQQQPGPSNPNQMLDIMPDLHLIQHEWAAHGTCSGLKADAYFGLIRRTFTSLKIPAQFVHPTRQFSIAPAALKQAFEQANPAVSGADIAVSCHGPYLVAVEVCVTKDGKPTACSGMRDCRASVLRVPKIP